MNLFFYGVLREGLGDWPFLAGIGPGRAATTRGTLHAIAHANGWYPALTAGDGEVHGISHEAGGADLAAMDAFEGSDYARRAIAIEIEGAALIADAYVWVAPLPGTALPIPHGDFARWLAETGNRPFAG